MASGKLRSRVRFEREAVMADDGYGNERQGWEAVATVAARIQPIRGRQLDVAGDVKSHVSHKIHVRKSSLLDGIDHTWRAVNARTGDVFDIASVINPDERDRCYEIQAIRGKLT